MSTAWRGAVGHFARRVVPQSSIGQGLITIPTVRSCGSGRGVTMRSPIKWFGGKGLLVPKLLPLFPEHTRYVEPFGGGASVLFAKPPCSVEVYNDRHGGLVNLFRVLRDLRLFPELQRRLVFTPYARQEYDDSLAWWKEHGDEDGDPVTRAWHFFVIARMSFSGNFGASWSSVVDASCGGMAQTASSWLSAIDRLSAVHRRLMRVQIECYDWRVILERYNGAGWLVYADPPYVQVTRKSGEYTHEITDADHEDLIDRLLAYDGSVVLSGYVCDAYRRLDGVENWSRVDIETVCHAAGRTHASGLQGSGAVLAKQPRTESVWVKDMSGGSLWG